MLRRFVVLLALAALAFACGERELPEGAVRTVVERAGDGRRVIVLGLDGADWRLLDPLVADGTMPRLGELLRHAERRVLLTQHPPLSPLVWTSMMTGVSPLDHRVLDFTRVNPRTRRQEPITSDERAVPAIWNMARYGGRRAAVFGLWATAPAEVGVVVTDRELPLDYREATEAVHARAKTHVEREKPDLAIVYVQGTDEIGHFEAGDVAKVRPYFRRIDAIVGEWQTIAKSLDAELLIVSDHGFDWGGAHGESSTATATAAKWHRNEGVWIRWPRESASTGSPARVDQLCATLLEILGLPPDARLAPPVGDSTIRTAVDYRRYFTRVTAQATRADDAEAVAKLRALGYVGSGDVAVNATSTRTPSSFNNEGLLLLQAKRVDEAERALAEALKLDPAYASARTNLDDLLATRGVERLRAKDCRGALADFRAVRRESALLFASIAAAEGCLGNDEAALAAVRRSLELDPQQPALKRMIE